MMRGKRRKKVNSVYNLYEPHPKQALFHKDAGKVFFRGVIAATGSGKTLCGCYEDIRWCTSEKYKPIIGYVYEPSFRMVKDILLPTLKSSLILGDPIESNPHVKFFHKTDRCIYFKNGSELHFSSLEDPERAEGPNIDFAHVDEARLVRNLDLALRVIRRRIRGSRSSNLTTPKKLRGLWVTSTPPPLTPKDPLYRLFVNPTSKLKNSKVYRFTIYDNPYVSQDWIRDQIESHQAEGLRRRFILGEFAPAGEGSFYFDQDLHVKAFSEGFHENMKDIRYGVDFGWSNPSCILAVGFDGDKRAFVLDEFYASRKSKEELLWVILEFFKKFGVGEVICDGGEPETIEYINQKVRDYGVKANNYKHKRDESIRELGGRFQKAGDGRPRIYVNSKCVNLINELMEYNKENKENDHAVDALRYAIPLKKETPRDAWVFG